MQIVFNGFFLFAFFFEENHYNETVFDDFCKHCLCYALKAVSYFLDSLFLEEKCN